jgi:hypothetical protein
MLARLMDGPLPGSLHEQIALRLGQLFRFAWETVGEGEEGDEPRRLRAWDLARGWFKRELDFAERTERTKWLGRGEG